MAHHVPLGASNGPAFLTSVLAFGSQIVSNVPLIMLLEPWIRTLPNQELAWTLTALVSTLAGNLTLLGSVANIIVVQQAKAGDSVDFWRYARVGVPVTVVTIALAVGFVLLRLS
jgi:Na+/H+ antiporter NhaD/arsenite permease-like protein